MNKPTLPFTDLPRPTRTHRLSIVAVWNPIEDELRCENPACEWRDFNYEEVTECPTCGRWMCPPCFQRFAPLCDDCAKLTTDERRAVQELREKLDH